MENDTLEILTSPTEQPFFSAPGRMLWKGINSTDILKLRHLPSNFVLPKKCLALIYHCVPKHDFGIIFAPFFCILMCWWGPLTLSRSHLICHAGGGFLKLICSVINLRSCEHCYSWIFFRETVSHQSFVWIVDQPLAISWIHFVTVARQRRWLFFATNPCTNTAKK